MFDRIMCVLVRIKVRGHLVMSIIQFLNFISVHFWTYLPQTRTGDDLRKFLLHVSEERGRFVFLHELHPRTFGRSANLSPNNRH